MSSTDVFSFLTVHRDLADDVFGSPKLDRICAIQAGLARHGLTLAKLDVVKRSTRAKVVSRSLISKSTYSSLDGFFLDQESAIRAMDEGLEFAQVRLSDVLTPMPKEI